MSRVGSVERTTKETSVLVEIDLDGSGKVDIVAGGYEDWIRKRYQDHRQPAKSKDSGSAVTPPQPKAAASKLSYKDQRDYDRLPAEIERLEAAVAADEEALHDPDLFARNPKEFAQLTERIARHRTEIEAAELRWLEVAEMAEQLTQA